MSGMDKPFEKVSGARTRKIAPRRKTGKPSDDLSHNRHPSSPRRVGHVERLKGRLDNRVDVEPEVAIQVAARP